MTEHGGETFDAPGEWMKYYSSTEQRKREMQDSPYLKQDSGKKPEKVGNFRI